MQDRSTIAFLVSRTLLQDWVRRRFGAYFEAIDRGFEKDGNFYLFSIRMVPAFPFFVVNLLMGLTRIRVAPFYLVSQAGMLPATFLYVYYGAVVGEVAAVAAGAAVERDTAYYVTLGVGLVATLVVTALVTRIARRALREATGD